MHDDDGNGYNDDDDNGYNDDDDNGYNDDDDNGYNDDDDNDHDHDHDHDHDNEDDDNDCNDDDDDYYYYYDFDDIPNQTTCHLSNLKSINLHLSPSPLSLSFSEFYEAPTFLFNLRAFRFRFAMQLSMKKSSAR